MDWIRTKFKRPTPVLVIFASIAVLISLMSAYSQFYDFSFSGSRDNFLWVFFYYGKYVFTIPLIVYAFFNRRITQSERKVSRFLIFTLWLPLILMMIWTVMIWIMKGTTMPYITRAASSFIFMSISVLGGIATASLFKRKSISMIGWALCGVYFISLIQGFSVIGPSFLDWMMPFYERPTTMFVELHEISYILGMFLLYFLLMDERKNTPHRIALIVCSLFFFIVAGKRIGYMAFAGALLYGLFMKRQRSIVQVRCMVVVEWIALLICLFYIYMTMSDDLVKILNELGISPMGRNIIFNHFKKFGEFTPTFLGNGYGFVSRAFDYATVDDLYNMISIKALHNDFFKIFLEIGFVGVILWLWYWLRHIPVSIAKKFSVKASVQATIVIFYAFVTYTTDNTESYFMFQFCLSMVLYLICYEALEKRKRVKEKLLLAGEWIEQCEQQECELSSTFKEINLTGIEEVQ